MGEWDLCDCASSAVSGFFLCRFSSLFHLAVDALKKDFVAMHLRTSTEPLTVDARFQVGASKLGLCCIFCHFWVIVDELVPRDHESGFS